MADIKPYKIEVQEEKLLRLKEKLRLTDFPSELKDAEWTYGTPLKDIKDLTKYWIEKYDWRAAEHEINKIPQFHTEITVDGFSPLDIHFVHQISPVQGAIPLLFVHGWPGNFHEVSKLLPLLKGGNGKPAFHVVAPSLPNYGFSGIVKEKGFALGQYAEACHKLMLACGYDEYVTQGGDWGAFITRAVGSRYPEHCKASHINMVIANEPVWSEDNPKPEYTERDKEHLAKRNAWATGDERGYSAIQGSKPATLAFSLQDSPVGLLAWIYDKLKTWTDAYPWTPDEILTWISIYYFSTPGPAASTYTYYEVSHDPNFNFDLVGGEVNDVIRGYLNIPLGIADFPKELAGTPRSWWGTLGPVVSEKIFDKGGHFAAWERPGDLAGQLSEMFGKGGGAEGVVKGKNGY